MNYMYSHVISG